MTDLGSEGPLLGSHSISSRELIIGKEEEHWYVDPGVFSIERSMHLARIREQTRESPISQILIVSSAERLAQLDIKFRLQ